MAETSTIQLDKKIINSMKDIKEYPRQTYNELISKMIKVFKALKSKNQYDEFLHRIQQLKMQELWDNEYDEAWEDA